MFPGPVLHPRRPWEGRRIVLGVTGGVAAYKAVQLARDLTRLGAEVDTVLTDGAQRFVRPLSFDGVTGRSTATELFSTEGAALHIRLGSEADVVCVAPATADLIARAAQGRADDRRTTTLLAARAPVPICPAMNDRIMSSSLLFLYRPDTKKKVDIWSRVIWKRPYRSQQSRVRGWENWPLVRRSIVVWVIFPDQDPNLYPVRDYKHVVHVSRVHARGT